MCVKKIVPHQPEASPHVTDLGLPLRDFLMVDFWVRGDGKR